MDAELKQRMLYELMVLENAKKEYTSRLKHLRDYKGAKMKRSRPGKKTHYYYVRYNNDKEYLYKGNDSNTEVRLIKETKFLEEAIRRIDNNICVLKSVMSDYMPYDMSSVSESLREVYRCKVPPVSELYESEGLKWKTGRLEFQKGFPENYPEKKTHKTSDGVMVKTISELVLYERFKAAGLALVYELPLTMNDYGPPLYPDFTILSPIDMKTEIIIEYAGLLSQWNYATDFGQRICRYLDNGYELGVNLFFVYGDRNGNIDSTQITQIIAEITGLFGAQVA